MRTVLVTGANGLIRRELTRQYAADGWRVFATGIGMDSLAGLCAEYPAIAAFEMDVTDFARVEEVAAQIDEPLDLVISNAGYYVDLLKRFGGTDYEAFRRMVEINTVGPLHLSETFAPLVERSLWKKMVFISARQGSISLNVTGGAYGYRASKAALNACIKSMSIDLLHRGIAVLALHPGYVSDTDELAPLTGAESVRHMRSVIRRYNLHETGSFLMFNDNPLPW